MTTVLWAWADVDGECELDDVVDVGADRVPVCAHEPAADPSLTVAMLIVDDAVLANCERVADDIWAVPQRVITEHGVVVQRANPFEAMLRKAGR